jgi:hypothetical protein
MAKTLVQIYCDRSELEAQLLDLKRLVETKFSNHVIGELPTIPLDVLIGNNVTTVSAGAAHKVTVGLRFGARFERLITALGTGKWDVVLHVAESLHSLDSFIAPDST